MPHIGTLRARISDSFRFQSDKFEMVIPAGPKWPALKVHAYTGGKLIAADVVVFSSGPYPTKEDAAKSMQQLADCLRLVFVRWGFGIDMGWSTPGRVVAPFAEDCRRDLSGMPMVEDGLGLHVYREGDHPRFVKPVALDRFFSPDESVAGRLADALHAYSGVEEQTRLAIDFVLAANFESNREIAFLLRVMAVETLSTQAQLGSDVQSLVREFVDAARKIKDEHCRESVVGRLRYLAFESIGSSCRRLIKTNLPGWSKNGKTAEKLFSTAYALRSAMLHGRPTPETRNAIEGIADAFGELCRDLMVVIASAVPARI